MATKTNVCASGKQQSPINIQSSKAVRCNALCDLTYYYRTSQANFVHSGNNIILDYDNGSYIIYNSGVYQLDKVSFSIPSSHKIDNNSYPLEVHINHKSTDTGRMIIIAVLFEINDAISPSQMFFDVISNSLPKYSGQQNSINTSDEWNIFNIIPEIKSFYSYSGSLPRSPCTEDVTWIVLESTSNVPTRFYDSLRQIISNNTRPIQNLNNRKIFYNPNNTDKNKRNYGDKLRCYTDEQFRKACSCMSGHKEIASSRQEQIKFITIIVSILILFVLLILYLIQENFFSKFLDTFKNLLTSNLFLAYKT